MTTDLYHHVLDIQILHRDKQPASVQSTLLGIKATRKSEGELTDDHCYITKYPPSSTPNYAVQISTQSLYDK